jgi:predicted phage-related endonuclease
MIDPATIRIGSGIIAAVVGASRWKTPMEAWNQLLGYEGARESDEINLGNMLEEPIARIACTKLGIGGYTKAKTFDHPSELWAKATPDWWIVPSQIELLETKNVGVSPGPHGPMEDWRRDGELVLPEYVEVQVQWQLGLWAAQEKGAPTFSGRARVAALLGGRGPELFGLEYDAGLFSDLMTIADTWRRKYILRHTPPTGPDGSKAFSRYLRARHPKSSGEYIAATPEDELLLRNLRRAEENRKLFEEAEKVCEQALQTRIGDALGIIGGAGRVTWGDRKAYTVAAHEVKASRRLTAKWSAEWAAEKPEDRRKRRLR